MHKICKDDRRKQMVARRERREGKGWGREGGA